MINTQMFGVMVQAVEEIRQTVLKTAYTLYALRYNYHFVSCSSTKYYWCLITIHNITTITTSEGARSRYVSTVV